MPRVMVVDDDPEIRASLAMALGRAGYDVASAEDGRSALQRMRDQKPDLLLTDIMMPHTDGWALIRSIRADANLADMKVLVMSGSLRMRELAIQHSAVGFLLKPFNWATAVGEVTRVLNCQNCP